MAKKERSYNPAQEQHKRDKKRALDKAKQQRQTTHLQHLSRRNPSILESQIHSLKQIDSQGRLTDADRAILISLEKELRLVKKAKALASSDEKRGPVIVSDRTKRDEAERFKLKEREERKRFREVVSQKRDPKRSVYYDEVWNPYGVPPPGMPWRERDEDDEDGWSTDSEVRRIPMPRDTPPPTRTPAQPPQREPTIRRDITPPPRPKTPEPIPEKQGPSDSVEEAFLRAGATVVEAAPVLRDFQKEATVFVPSVVRRRPPPPTKKQQTKVEEEERPHATDGAEVPSDEVMRDVEEIATDDKTVVETDPEFLEIKRTTENTGVAAGDKSAIDAVPPTEDAPRPKRRRMINAAPDV